ncbi:prepilin-type N-terminal cleavage/methylation domain-containing protein [Campylobacter sp. faydin G-24]|uniref:Prepilin-type N-terminal cleavage/methylation domain-containing protein n=1 Tax=Campylobacter anatolicus TaxID=2829105 RepID=A0ABS5HJR3_9BACT|nr:prepilin-type N-terminal cleavage/methylation domain-containing protein [Campylobacter anatolicus]MBR8464387.1 prepilin-type N-terminal cleavage/methylation domain-containing protein [Campylobacter anatolicus]
MVKRAGFSLIEAVLSIIIISLISTGVPLIIKQISQTNKTSLLQESVMNAKTYLITTLNAPFTCEHINNNPNELLPIFYGNLNTNGEYIDFYKKWHIQGDGRRNFMPKDGVNLNKSCGANDIKSINDFSGENFNLNGNNLDFIISSAYQIDVKNDNKIFNENEDIKHIKVIATNNDTQINLSGFVANIGDAAELNTKEWR